MADKASRFSSNISVRNKRAGYEYNLYDKFSAGIVLKGSEIKSIREGKVSIAESYCFFNGDELLIRGMNISAYKEGGYDNHEAARDRKLLLTKVELKKLWKKSQEKGLTIVPLRLYINNRGLAKLDIALGQGKKLHDKRHSIKEKDLKRDIKYSL
jgi:SsrA-binding protein